MAISSQPEGAIRTRWSSEDAADQFTVDNPATGATLAVVQGWSAATTASP
jgi:hypothetical protein